MPKPKLPKPVREKIKDLFRQGYSNQSVFRFVKDEAKSYVSSDQELSRCISSLKGKVKRQTRVIVGKPKEVPHRAKAKEFNLLPHRKIMSKMHKDMPGKELERLCGDIASDILRSYEGFKKVQKGPKFQGTPFDFFGFKDGAPYLVELKASLSSFHSPGETQKRRLQDLLDRIRNLRVPLLQVKLNKASYRIFYEEEMKLLFYGPKAPIEPIEKWIREQCGINEQ